MVGILISFLDKLFGSRKKANPLDIIRLEREPNLSTSVDVPFEITEVVSGGARGVDALGERWAREHGIPIRVFPADWTVGKSAGYIRNAQMARYAEALVAFHFNGSRGTANMIEQAKQHGLEVFVVKL